MRTLTEYAGVLTDSAASRSWQAPPMPITTFRVVGGDATRTGSVLMLHRDWDLPFSINAGPRPQGKEHEPWKPTEPMTERWKITEDFFEAERLSATADRQTTVFMFVASIGLLASVLALGMRIGLAYVS